MRTTNRLYLLLALVVPSAGCLDTATNEDEVLSPVDQGKPSGDGDGDTGGGDGDSGGGGDGDTGGGDGDTGGGGDGDTGGGDGDTGGGGDGDTGGGGDGDTGGGDGGTGGGDGGTGGGGESVISGSAEASDCASNTAKTANTCYGFYCGVSQETLASELSEGRKCDYPVEDACAGLLSTKVGACARMVKSQNIFASDEEIRTKTGECVYGDAHLKDTVPTDCMDCYLDAAMCASKNCVTQCLAGDSANCDKCRLDNNCNQPVPGCAGLPSPF